MQQRFKSDSHNFSALIVKKDALSSNDEIRMQTLDCRKALAYGTSRKIIDKNENTNKQKKLNIQMILDIISFDIINDKNFFWSFSVSGKADSSLNLINHKPNLDKIYLYEKLLMN